MRIGRLGVGLGWLVLAIAPFALLVGFFAALALLFTGVTGPSRDRIEKIEEQLIVIDEGLEPACVAKCVTKCLHFGRVEDTVQIRRTRHAEMIATFE